MPGSGKTTALMNLMIELHKRGIPFLTIECSKRDFRALTKLARKGDAESLSLAQDLQVYTLGKEDVSPFRMNPLALASDVTLPEHLDSVLACFYAAMPLSGPLPAVLGEALELVYEGQENGDPPPVMADLVKAAEEVLKSKGYSPDVESDIRAAIEVRLTVLVCRSMGKILQSPSAVPAVEALLSGYSVIELDRLPVDQKCLTSLFLLKAILDEVRSLPPHADGLRFVVLIDEAHNVVGSTSSSVRSEDLADPGSHASEYVCRMLAELRGLGVGIVISDQLPTAVASEVVKQTGTKLAFRQVDLTDREIISRAMLLTQVEEEDLARLRPGEAFFFTEGLYAPLRIRTVNLHQDLDLAPPSDCELGRIIRREPWFKANATALGALEFTFASGQSDIFDGERANIAAKAARLLSCLLSAKATNDDAARQRKLVALHAEVCPLQERLRSLSRGFRRTVLPSVERYSRQAEHDHPWPPELIDAWGEFARRVHDVTLADTERLLGLLGRVVTECGASRNTRV
ncbi:MAG: ATP-binding protein, partial [Lentisphaerae bacterium]|nr:ATP-binding protein [Lentisphaerota bacterium]